MFSIYERFFGILKYRRYFFHHSVSNLLVSHWNARLYSNRILILFTSKLARVSLSRTSWMPLSKTNSSYIVHFRPPFCDVNSEDERFGSRLFSRSCVHAVYRFMYMWVYVYCIHVTLSSYFDSHFLSRGSKQFSIISLYEVESFQRRNFCDSSRIRR